MNGHAIEESERLVSIDAFRGAVIAAMLLVDGQSGTHTYAMFKHSIWNGLSFTDCIAPCFMWVVGVALFISLNKRLSRGDDTVLVFRYVVRRSVILFGLGVILNVWQPLITAIFHADSNYLDSLRLMGTLQRIAISYLVVSAILIYFPDPRKHIAIIFGLITTYTLIFYLIPAHGFHHGDFSLEKNAVTYIDKLILGCHSGLSHPLLNTIPATAMVILGSLIGRILIESTDRRWTLGLLSLIGILLLGAGAISSFWIPINYKLWTTSFSMLAGSIACLSFSLFYWLVEMKDFGLGTGFLRILGMNPLVIWVAAILTKTILNMKGLFDQQGNWHPLWEILSEKIYITMIPVELNSLVFASLFMFSFYLIAYLLYSRNIIVRI